MLIKSTVERLCRKAKLLLKQNNNFIHTPEHADNVFHNVKELIAANRDVDLNLIKIGCYWHDVGRNDFRKEFGSKGHEQISAEKLSTELDKLRLNPESKEKIINVIVSHRNRGSKIKPLTPEAKILWDADKLDIFNVKRLKKIFAAYDKGQFSNDFNYIESFKFYDKIDRNFEKKFYTRQAREKFQKLYPIFKSFIKNQREKIFGSYNKAILIGGGDLLSDKQNNINQFILSFSEKKTVNVLYIAAGLTQELKAICDYLNKVKKHFETISNKKVIFKIILDDIDSKNFAGNLKNSDIIYLAGGDTQKLINFFKKNKLALELKKTWQKGKLIVGNSAGALTLAKTGISLYREPKKYRGIDVIKKIIPVVHYDSTKNSALENILDKKSSMKSLRISENEACVLWGKQVIKINNFPSISARQ